MANEFIIKNGFYSNGNSAITGSLIVSASGATNDLQIGTNKLFVSAAGNVGIGTTTPSAKLTVQVTGSAANALVANFIKSPAASNETGSTFIRISTYPALITGSGLYTDIEFNSGYQGPFRYGTYADTNIINGYHSTTGNYGSINFVTSGSTRMTIAGGTSAGRVGIGTTSPNATLDVNGSAIISGSLTTTSSVAFKAYTSATSFPGTAVGYLAFDTAGNIITKEGVGAFPYTGSAQITGSLGITGSLTTTGSVVFSGLTSNITSNVVYIEPTTKQLSYGISKNIGNSDLTIDFDTTRVLYHDGLSRLIISKSEAPSAVLELKNTSTGGNKVLVMEQLLDSNANRGGNRQFTAGGDSPNSATFNGYAMDSIVEYLSGSSGSTNKLQGWKWSYYNGVDYANVLLISTSNAAVLNATLDVNGNTKITGSLTVTGSTAGNLVRITQTGAGNAFVVEDSANPDANAFVIDNTGKVFIGATSASGTFNSMSPAPKLDVSGSVVIAGKIQIGNDTDTTNEYKLYSGQGPIFARTGDPLIGDAAIVGVAYNSTDIGPTLGTYIGVNGNATQGDDDDPASTYIGGQFYAGGFYPDYNYAVQLQDGSQGIGKVLVSQTADGKARWSTQLSGSYGLTGSLSFPISSSLLFSSSNSIYSGRMHVSNLPNPLGSSTVSSPLYNYGAAGEGLYIQFGESSDVGGIKITDDGVAVFGAGDNDLFKVVNEDTNQQIFVINDLNQVGINKAFTPGANSAMNAALDVNGNAIITGSLTVTGSYASPAGNTIDSNALIQSSLLYLSNNF